MKLRLGVILHHIENASYADTSETLYYGSVIKDPDMGVRYTFAKSPNGDITLLQTESTDAVLDSIGKLMEVATESTWEPMGSKLTFLVKWDDVDYVYTWNDRIIDQFKIMVDDRFNELKPYISTVTYNKNKSIRTPFIQDDMVAVSFEFTKGRSIKYLSKLIPELFRRILDEHLIIDNKIEELMNDKFTILDKLKANDSRQDNDVVKASVADAYAHAVRKNIEDWLNDNNDVFQTKYTVKTLDLTRYPDNQKCFIKLTSNVITDNPILESDIFSEDGNDALFVKCTTSGMVLKEKIRRRTSNILSGSESFAEHTFVARGGSKLVIYTSSKDTNINVVRTATAEYNRVKDTRNESEVVHNMLVNKELLMIRESDNKAIYPVLKGTPPKEGAVGFIYDWIWRAATKNHWGEGAAGNNTQALKENRDIGDWCNTRKTFTLMNGITVDDIVNTYETLDIYIDLYCGLASGGGDGGIQGVFDATNGRLSYQGYATLGDNIKSIPANKLKVPLKMTSLESTSGCFVKVSVNCKDLKKDGSWLLVYNMPRSRWNSTIGQWRRKGWILGLLGWKYYLRVIPETNELEMLVNYDQQADGDRGNRCYTQGASRDSYFIYGNKPNTLQVEMKDKWSNETVATYDATNYKQFNPSLKIEDIENNYVAYLPLQKSDTKITNTYKVDDIITGDIYYAVAAQTRSNMYRNIKMFANIRNRNNVYTKEFEIVRLNETSDIYDININLLTNIKFSNNKEESVLIEEHDNMKYNELSEPMFNINDNKFYILTKDNNIEVINENFINSIKYEEVKTIGKPVDIDTNMNTISAEGRDVFMNQSDNVTIDLDLNKYYNLNNDGYNYSDDINMNLDKINEELDLDIIININNMKTLIKRKLIKLYENNEFIFKVVYEIPPYLEMNDYIVDLNIIPNYKLINKESK